MSSEPTANILLVDDNPANLLAVEGILADLGQNLVKASSGEEALNHLQVNEFAVILLDVRMHGLSGFETAKRIRARERSTPIIFLTAYEGNDLRCARPTRWGRWTTLLNRWFPQS
jgi:CheY-like chemotaxis protein